MGVARARAKVSCNLDNLVYKGSGPLKSLSRVLVCRSTAMLSRRPFSQKVEVNTPPKVSKHVCLMELFLIWFHTVKFFVGKLKLVY